MANTYTQLYIHFVFAVMNRACLIQFSWKDELFKYISGIVKRNGHKLIVINGVADHVHILIGYRPHQLIPELMQDVKGDSSKWINQKGLIKHKFQWQQGYGAFSHSRSQIDRLVKYINNQERHHKRRSFEDEYVNLLRKYHVVYDHRFLMKGIN